MATRGSGGRWHADDELDAQEGAAIDAMHAPSSGLSVIEVVCFAVVIALLFWLARELGNRGANAALFQGLAPERHMFLNLAIAVAAYLFGLSGTGIAGQPRIAGAMLSAVVGVALLYVLLFLRQNLYVTGGAIALATGSALCSRTGLPRDQGYPAALVAASLIMIAHSGIAWAIR